jgi:hypothetical protein
MTIIPYTCRSPSTIFNRRAPMPPGERRVVTGQGHRKAMHKKLPLVIPVLFYTGN